MPAKLPPWAFQPNETWSGPKGTPNEYDLTCPECGKPMRLRYSKKNDSRFYGCTGWPDCDVVHGAHPDGKPLGKPGDRATRSARKRAHEAFDQLWKPAGARMTRGQAYAWLEGYFDLDEDEAHIGNFDSTQCEELVAALLCEFGIEV